MNEVCLKNTQYSSAENKKGLYDIAIVTPSSDSIVVFMHGYMGFKDWGCWNLAMNFFTDKGVNFAKLNVTHNGTTLNSPIDFEDLDAFSKNSYWKEYCDLNSFLSHLETVYSMKKIHLIGHSRGGGIVLLSAHHPSVTSITTWAGISSIEKRFPAKEKLNEWKETGVYFVENGRTNQFMPHSFSQYEEYLSHKASLSIEKACRKNSKPICIIHGTSDTSVSIIEGQQLSEWTTTELIQIEETNHTFDAKHPWKEKSLPSALLKACEYTLQFISSIK